MPFLNRQKFEKIAGSGKEKAPPPKEIKKDTSGFGGKPHIPREEFKRWARRPELFAQTDIPEEDRVKLLEEDLGPEYGSYIEKGEPEKVLKKLREKRFQAKTGAEQAAIDKKIKLWDKFLGK